MSLYKDNQWYQWEYEGSILEDEENIERYSLAVEKGFIQLDNKPIKLFSIWLRTNNDIQGYEYIDSVNTYREALDILENL